MLKMLKILSQKQLSISWGHRRRQQAYFKMNDLKKQRKTRNLLTRMKKGSSLPPVALNFIKKEAKKLRICKTTLSMSQTRLMSLID